MEYLAELSYGDIKNFEGARSYLAKGYFKIESKFNFKISENEKTESLDFGDGKIKLKFVGDSVPEEVKAELIRLFQSYPNEYQL